MLGSAIGSRQFTEQFAAKKIEQFVNDIKSLAKIAERYFGKLYPYQQVLKKSKQDERIKKYIYSTKALHSLTVPSLLSFNLRRTLKNVNLLLIF